MNPIRAFLIVLFTGCIAFLSTTVSISVAMAADPAMAAHLNENAIKSVKIHETKVEAAESVRKKPLVRIAVLESPGPVQPVDKWRLLSVYLGKNVPSRRFQVETLPRNAFKEAIAGGGIDYVVTDAFHARKLQDETGLINLARVKTLVNGKPYSSASAVLFTNKAHQGIQTVDELRGLTLVAIKDSDSWWMIWKYLVDHRFLPEQDFYQTDLTAKSESELIQAVLNGKADIGLMRSDRLAYHLAFAKRQGKTLPLYPLLKEQHVQYPVRHTAGLYPDWSLLATVRPTEKTNQQVMTALLEMPTGGIESRGIGIAGWTYPTRSEAVSDLFKTKDDHNQGLVPDVVDKNPMLGWSLFFLMTVSMTLYSIYGLFLRKKLNTEVSKQDVLSKKLEYQALYDSLTQLPNRVLFQDRLLQAIKACHRNKTRFGVIMCDLDRFKEVNDTLGHQAGDQLLQQVALRLQKHMRQADTLARLGGDEFAILFHDINDPLAISSLAKRLIACLEDPIVVDGTPCHVGISLGISVYPDHGQDPDILLRRADIALYRAKVKRNDFAVYDKAVDQHSRESLLLESELRAAVNNDELEVHFQPKINCTTNRINGVEALARWYHKTNGIISPGVFIPIAEQSGLMKKLTLVVLKKSLARCSNWYQKGIALNVSVNVTAENLEDVNFPSEVAYLLKRFKFPANLLELEITEEAIINNIDRANANTQKLTEMGVTISIDDFGTGNSSISYLKKLPISTLKIDQSFIKEMLESNDDSAIVKSTIALSKSLGLSVIAEGVEDQQTLRALQLLGCDMVQGFYMCKPIPAEDLTKWLLNSEWGVSPQDAEAHKLLSAESAEPSTQAKQNVMPVSENNVTQFPNRNQQSG
ncbi:MAG: EAL domain-containing protein [Vampirovibrio sp.]|nr:EAL domain-containing protein [Vampirovibrio sp.]